MNAHVRHGLRRLLAVLHGGIGDPCSPELRVDVVVVFTGRVVPVCCQDCPFSDPRIQPRDSAPGNRHIDTIPVPARHPIDTFLLDSGDIHSGQVCFQLGEVFDIHKDISEPIRVSLTPHLVFEQTEIFDWCSTGRVPGIRRCPCRRSSAAGHRCQDLGVQPFSQPEPGVLVTPHDLVLTGILPDHVTRETNGESVTFHECSGGART